MELNREKRRLQERDNHRGLIRSKKRVLECENLRVLKMVHMRNIQRKLLGEKNRGMEREKRREKASHLREPMKMRKTRDKACGKRASSNSRVVEEATDDPSRPIPGGPTDRSILVNFNNHVAATIWKNEGNIDDPIDDDDDLLDLVRRTVDVVQKWKALPASESTMTLAEKMADDVLRHLAGKGSSISNAFEEGTQSGSHTVGYASGPSKRKHSGTYQPPMKPTKGKK
ncbi:hypothetical protein Scep_019262 [Stephania cephalantha]|uniref:Uncharacterized protein n=1 Tax=Stephania cephalantha TaxID=152367 RepID=A0AAP0NLZ6_9MAGN